MTRLARLWTRSWTRRRQERLDSAEQAGRARMARALAVT